MLNRLNSILFQKSTKEKAKLNNSTCTNSETSDSDSTDSEVEEVNQKLRPSPTMGCIQSRGAGVNKVLL